MERVLDVYFIKRSVLLILIIQCFSLPLHAAWLIPMMVSSGNPVQSFDIAADSIGNIGLIWIENKGASASVRAVVQPYDRSFLPTVALSEGASSVSSPKIAFDFSQNLVASWIQDSVLKCSERRIGGSWSQSLDISNQGASESGMGIDNDSQTSVFIWNQGGQIFSRLKQLGKGLSDFTILSSNGTRPDIRLNGSGYGAAIWLGPSQGVKAVSWCAANGWSVPATLDTAGADHPQIGIDSSMPPKSIAVWTNAVAYTASSEDIWTLPDTLGGLWAFSPKIAVNKAGDAAVIWMQNGIVQVAVRYAAETDFSEPLSLSLPESASPSIDIDEEGNIAAIWMHHTLVQTSLLPRGGTWSPAAFLTITGISSTPKIKFSGRGMVNAAWIFNDDVNTFVQYTSTNMFLEPPSSIKGRQIKNHFFNIVELVNEISWEPSPSSSVTGYYIYRNYSQLTKIPKGKKYLFQDRDRNPKNFDTYHVIAVDYAGNQSDSLMITLPIIQGQSTAP